MINYICPKSQAWRVQFLPCNFAQPTKNFWQVTMRISSIVCLIALFNFSAAAQRTKLSTEVQPVSQQRSATPASNFQNVPSQAEQTKATTNTPTSRDNTSKKTKSKRTTARSPQIYPAPTTKPLDNGSATTSTANPKNAGDQKTANTHQTTTPTGKNVNPQTAAAAPEKPVKVEWMSIEEAEEKSKTEKRKIFVDVYTDWCGWCKRMDETTFSDPAVAKYLNENYYPVKFDAEQEQSLTFRGKNYEYKKMGNRGYHEFAIELLNNRLSFPTVVFLNEDLQTIQSLATYLDAPKFETIINYFGTDSHKKTPWEAYERSFVRNR